MDLLARMVREEWRMHARLFGGRGFALFPLLMLLLTTGTYLMAIRLGFAPARIGRGLHYIVFFFGLNVGTIGFAGRDALENLLGEASLLIFSARTLPVTRRRLLATFLVKDLLYYGVLFILPIVLGLSPAAAATGVAAPSTLLLWLSVTGAFMLGVVVSVTGAALYLRGRAASLAGLLALGGTGALLGTGLLAYTPLAFFDAPGPATFLRGFLPIPVLGAAGLFLFRPGHRSRTRTARPLLPALRDLPGVDRLVAKLLLDMRRSSGGFTKLFVSQGVIVLVFLFLALNVPVVGRFLAAPPLGFAVVLGLGSVSVYAWLNRFDRPEAYDTLPIGTAEVVRAKFRAFLLLGVPVALVYLLGIGAVYGWTGIVPGLLVLPLVMVALFGITAFLTGTHTDELLFDARRFALFGAAASVVVVPLFVAAMLYPMLPAAGTFAVLYAAVMAGIGIALYRRAGPRWAERERS